MFFLAKRTTRHQTLKAEMVYKTINGLVPEYFTRKFIQRSDANPYNLRDFENKLAITLPTSVSSANLKKICARIDRYPTSGRSYNQDGGQKVVVGKQARNKQNLQSF